jgi:PHP family Zn ribbon phosphoesterase
VRDEAIRWKCPTCGGSICVHKGYCLNCHDHS